MRTGGFPYDLGNLHIGYIYIYIYTYIYIYWVDQVAARKTSVHNSPTRAIENYKIAVVALTKFDMG